MAAVATLANVLIAGLIGALAVQASATSTVYRCGPHGNVYSQLPCDSGRAIDVADPRSAEQVADARDASAAQSRLAHQMSNERRANERAMRPTLAAGIDYPAAAAAQAKIRSVTAGTGKATSRSQSRKTPRRTTSNEFVALGPRIDTGKKKRSRTQD